jgi:hypothetical protein
MATTISPTAACASNVYLFKNGYGMFVKTFEFPPNKDNNGKPVELIDPPSNPVHGTFWIQSSSNNSNYYFFIYIHHMIYFFSFNKIYSCKKDTYIC